MLRLAVRVAREQAEIVLAELLELVPEGVEEVDRGPTVEYAVYGAPGELPALPRLRAAAGDALVEVTCDELPDGWEERWKQFHRPTVLEDRVTIRPPWEPPGATEIDLVIDPGEAFGTGAHPTTRLCLELMLAVPRPAGALIDLGCGSGVLALAGARLGFSPVLALDHDPAAVNAAGANARLNGAEIEVRRFDLRSEPMPPAATVVANLVSALLIDWAARVPAGTQRVIAGGVLAGEADRVAGEFARAGGLHERERRTSGEWVALALER